MKKIEDNIEKTIQCSVFFFFLGGGWGTFSVIAEIEAHKFDQISKCFIDQTKICIDMEIFMKVNLSEVRNIFFPEVRYILQIFTVRYTTVFNVLSNWMSHSHNQSEVRFSFRR